MRQGAPSRSISRARWLVVVLVVLLTSACDWTTLGFDTGHTRATSDPGPGLAHPALVDHQWTGVVGSGTVTSPPIVTSDRVFVTTSSGELDAFPASVTSDTPGCEWQARCQPVWTAASGPSSGSSPTVFGGRIYTSSGDGVIRVFDAAGRRACGGTPRGCAPLWQTAAVGSLESSPLVLGGVVYVGSTDGNLYGYDAHGVTNCAANVCTPTLQVALDSAVRSSPIAFHTHVIVGADDGTIASFDPATLSDCTAQSCTPEWTATSDAPVRDALAVDNTTLLVGSETGTLRAYDVTGTTNCTAAPVVCSPLWSASTGSPIRAALAVRDGIVVAGSDDGTLHAFDVAPAGCTDPATTCPARWETDALGIAIHGAPGIADHRVIAGWADGRLAAFDLAGVAKCAGTPVVCTPEWSIDVGGDPGPPTISHGRLFVGAGDVHVLGTAAHTTTDDIGVATLTDDGDDTYTMNEQGASTVGVDAPTGNTGNDLRLAYFHPADPMSTDESSCATWTGDTGPFDQEGAALRVHAVAGGTKAITITKNIWFSANWIFNVHVWDTSASPVATIIGQFDLGSVLYPNGAYIPYPWSICARVVGNVVSFVVWPTGSPQPDWADPAYGGSVTLPPGFEDAGRPGWYVGHLRPGDHAGFGDLVANPIAPPPPAAGAGRSTLPRAPWNNPSVP